ncbi:MAG: YggS family pyridoxal phosphate-dependent enzyme [Actinomycetia bacterium]|nr:YggS family pyridoxal phosphate-dependent enzyme [Actinomycetes bacterium]
MTRSNSARRASTASPCAEDLARNLTEVRARIAAAAQRAGRDPAEVRLVAVSKTVSPQTAALLVDAGQLLLGENRVDRFLEKHEAIPAAQIHLIGSLQTNKVRYVVGRTPLIHSVDSQRLLEKIDARAAALDIIQPVLLEVNISGEGSKHGLTPQGARELVDAVAVGALACSHLLVNGLMTMAPLDSPEAVRWVFRELRRLRDELRQRSRGAQILLEELSMGMSNDFEVAVEEGATLVRIGTALFKETDRR